MTEKMHFGAARRLTAAEERGLSPGLLRALAVAGARPLVVARPALGARVAGLWRGRIPILAWRNRIYWPGALEDFSGTRQMATLQHELHHVLEFATGELTVLGYGLNPKNWRYGYRLAPGCRWTDFGAEQRASIVEELWRVEQAQALTGDPAARLRALIPWAHEKRPGDEVSGASLQSWK